MDDYLVGSAVLILLGFVILFFSSVLANHHRESPQISPPEDKNKLYGYRQRNSKNGGNTQTENSEMQNLPVSTDAYERLILRYQDRINPFSQIEACCYILAVAVFSYGLEEPNWIFVGYLGSILVFILFGRTLFYALGIRLANPLFNRLFPFISFLASATIPLSSLLNKIKRGIGGGDAVEDSREEIETLVDSAKEDGSLEDSEYRLLKNIMSFKEVMVSDVMTPRTVVFSLPEETKVGECIKIKEIRNYSRIPVYSGQSLDEGVKGYVTARDILAAYAEGDTDKELSELSRKIYFIPDNLELSKALEQFLVTQQHMYIVVDEYGGVDGLITMEDVLETVLGVEIVDEADSITDLRKLAKKTRDYRQKKKRGG